MLTMAGDLVLSVVRKLQHHLRELRVALYTCMTMMMTHVADDDVADDDDDGDDDDDDDADEDVAPSPEVLRRDLMSR